jgi:FtsH-binding integral membrane protein
MQQEYGYSDVGTQSSSLGRVFGWMGLALALTAFMSFTVYLGLQTGLIPESTFGGLMIASIAVYFLSYLYFMFGGVRYGKGNVLIPYVLYSGSFGVLLSTLPMVYSIELIGTAFFTSALVFGLFAWYGATTKTSMIGVGQFAMIALFGAILLSLFNLFIRSSGLDWVLSFVIFGSVLLIVSYQVWIVKQISISGGMSRHQEITAALSLYISFMNIFLRILRYLAYSRRR